MAVAIGAPALSAPFSPGGIAFHDLEKGERNRENEGTMTMMFFLPAANPHRSISSSETIRGDMVGAHSRAWKVL